MLQPKYKNKHNVIFMGFDSIEINLYSIPNTIVVQVRSSSSESKAFLGFVNNTKAKTKILKS